MSLVRSNIEEAIKLLNDCLNDPSLIENVGSATKLMVDAIRNGCKIISCGNGGSMSDAMHFAEELTGRFRDDRPAIPAVSISDPSYITCVGNDYGFEYIFSRFVEGVGKQGDILLAISTSGNSKNVVNAVISAQEKNMKVVALTGNEGGKIGELADIEIRVPYKGYADRIQEVHIKIIHSLIQSIENQL